MKTIHNIRVRVHSADRAIVDAVLNRADAMARKSENEVIEQSITEEDGLFIGQLWLDRQQPVRRFLKTLLTTMREHDKAQLQQKPTRFLDVGTHCFMHLSLNQFLTQQCLLTDTPAGAINLRLNIACWPANTENAAIVMQELFASAADAPVR